jgi:hypothetical protein
MAMMPPSVHFACMDCANRSELMLLSEAHRRLRDGMYGNLSPPAPLVESRKREHPWRPRIRWGPHLSRASQTIRGAAIDGGLTLYAMSASVMPQLKNGRLDAASIEDTLRFPVPRELVGRLITSRGGLPDHPIAVSRSRKLRDFASEEFLLHLAQSVLVVKRSEFEAWYRSERRRQRWPSQRPNVQGHKRRRAGRPKLDDLKITILQHVRDRETWSGKQPIGELIEQLRWHHPHVRVPSYNTFRRIIDELQEETGEPRLIRQRKVRRSRTV